MMFYLYYLESGTKRYRRRVQCFSVRIVSSGVRCDHSFSALPSFWELVDPQIDVPQIWATDSHGG